MMTELTEIIILNDYATLTGGSTAVAIASAVGLAGRGFPVTVFTCVGPVSPELQDVPNLKVICLDQPELAKDPRKLRAMASGLCNTAALAALRTLLATKDPTRTLVHAHTWMKALSPFALDLVTGMGFPLVVTLHDFFISCPNGGFFDHSSGEICRRAPLSLSCLGCNCDRRNYGHKLWRSVRTTMQNRFLKVPEKVACYVGVSGFSLDLMRPHLPAGVPATVIRNPIDCVDDGPALNEKNRPFLYIGRFVPEKGVRVFAEAVRATGLPAVFVGDGELMPELKRLCSQAQFTGWLNPAQIREQLRQSRALVFPSLWYETLGLVPVEAAASGIPAIVSDGCAATDYVADGRTGLHFTHGSAESLAAQLKKIAEDDLLTACLGRAAYHWYWSDPWTTERHVTDLIETYGTLSMQTPSTLLKTG